MSASISLAQHEENEHRLPTLRAASWHGTTTPDVEWLAHQRIPAGDVSLFTGDGGVGKTQCAVQLLANVARGAGDWLNTTITNGPVLFDSCEEPDREVRRRLSTMAHVQGFALSDLHDLHVVSDDADPTLATESHRKGAVIDMTPRFDRLEKTIDLLRPALIVTDSVAAVFGGDHVSRSQVRAFVSRLRAVCRAHNTTWLLLDHPSAAGIREGTGRTGSVDWWNAVRSVMWLKEEPEDVRKLVHAKSNYGPKFDAVDLVWERGVLIPKRGLSTIERAAAETATDTLFMTLFERMVAQGRAFSPNRSASFAPTIISNHPDAAGHTSKAFAESMDRLLNAGRLKVRTVGSPSKPVQRLVRGDT